MESEKSGLVANRLGCHCVFVNGPPRSGKDAGTIELDGWLSRMQNVRRLDETRISLRMKFADPLKAAVGAAFNLNVNDRMQYFETEWKDVPSPRFFGKSPREVLISFSENWAKIEFGQRVFGHWALQRVRSGMESGSRFFLFSDSGFQDEFDVLHDALDPQRLLVIRLERPGCDFGNDSRGYIDARRAHFAVVRNDGPLDAYHEKICEAVARTWPDVFKSIPSRLMSRTR